MIHRTLWVLLAVLYAVFFSWYTPWGGPLTADEIDGYLTSLKDASRTPEQTARWRAFMESDTGGDFAMVNVIELRDTPKPVEGVSPGETSGEVLSRYSEPFMRDAMRDAAHPVFFGFAAAGAMDLWGIQGAERWTNGALVRYRSRRDLMNQAVRTASSHIHEFKMAAMEKTIAFPVDPWFHLGDPRLLLGLLFAVIGLAVHHLSLRRRVRG